MARVWLAVILAAIGFTGGCQILGGQQGPVLQGHIVWPRDGDVWVLDLANQHSTQITHVPRDSAVITSVKWSPDRTEVIYSQLTRRPDNNSTGADLWLARADGTQAHVLVAASAPSTRLETPFWTASGRIYYTERQPAIIGVDRVRILRKSEGSEPEVVVEDGFGPAVSADESMLTFLREERAGNQSLWKKALVGNLDECELLGQTVFQSLGVPRLAPDARTIALAASGPVRGSASRCQAADAAAAVSPTVSVRAGAQLEDWLGLFGPRTAWAHGPPWDIWTIRFDGTDLTKVAVLQADDPAVAWSPDGTRLAIFHPDGLFTVDAHGGQVKALVDRGAFGNFDWSR